MFQSVALKIYPHTPRGKGYIFRKKCSTFFYKIIPHTPPILHTPNLIYISYPYSSSFISYNTFVVWRLMPAFLKLLTSTNVVWFNSSSWWTSIPGTELVRKGFPLVRKGTRAALYGYSQKELAQFDLELRLFVFEPGPIGSGGDGLRVGTEACDDQNTSNGDGWNRRCQKRSL